MAMTLHVDIVSAEKSLYSGTAEVVIAPGQRGELGIYPRHTPTVDHAEARFGPHQGAESG